MTNLAWPVTIICIALVSVVIRVTQVFLSLHKRREPAKYLAMEAGCQTDSEELKLEVKSQSSQTEIVTHTRDVFTITLPVTVVSISTQTAEEAVSLPKVASSVSLPPTPSTIECSFEMKGQMESFNSPKVVESEQEAFDSDMDTFLKCAMTHVLSPTSDRPRAQTCTWFSESMDRYSTMDGDSTVVGGEIYRTVSEPIDFVDDSENVLLNVESIIETYVRPRNGLDTATLVNRVIRVLFEELKNPESSEKVAVIPFGSLASGLMSSCSSVDLALLIPEAMFEALFSAPSPVCAPDTPLNLIKEYETRLMMRKALQLVGEILTEKCALYVIKLSPAGSLAAVSTTKIPTLTLVDLQSGTRFEIACNNLFPLFSTQLVKTYTEFNAELGDLILLTKYWAYKMKLPLSGFACTLLCIFYCQTQLQVIPSLQGTCSERKQWKDPFGSRRCDVSFVESLANVNWGGLSGASLFMGFIDFYANYWDWSSGVVSVRLGRTVTIDSSEILIKQSNNTFTNSRIYIEDPFDSKKDLAATIMADQLRKEFVSTSWALCGSDSEHMKKLFDSLRGEDNQHFTPLRRTVTSISETPFEPTYRRSGSCQ